MRNPSQALNKSSALAKLAISIGNLSITDAPGGPPPDGPGHLNFQPVRPGVSQSCLTNDVADLGGVGDDETQPIGI